MDKSKKNKNGWKILYILLVVACLLCIGGMVLYLMKGTAGELTVENDTMEETASGEVAVSEELAEEAKELAELPVDFEKLQMENPEIYAWICIPGTKIDYPILQHEGEDQGYYLTRDLHGENSKAGSIYTEHYNRKDFTDPNTVIYGHNMKNGSMFHNLRYFAEREYFEEHEELYIYVPGKILKYQIFSCYEYDDRHILGSFDFSDEEVYASYLKDIMNPRSMYTMLREDVALTTENCIVTLSTCVANRPNNRRLLQAVFVEEIEAEYRGAADETES